MLRPNTELKKFVILEGNIGSGKSTLLSILKKRLDVDIIPEPTNQWQCVGESENLLNLFYQNTSRWAYTFQSYAFLTRVQAILDHLAQTTDHTKTFLLERSVYCDRFCFAKNCYERGNMSDLEWHIYQDWFSWLVQNFTPQPSGFIYLRSQPSTSHQRIQKRNRKEESSISLDYLQALHQKHDQWLILQEDNFESLRNTPVLTLECDNDFEHDKDEQDRIVQSVDAFIDTLSESIILKTTPLTQNSYAGQK